MNESKTYYPVGKKPLDYDFAGHSRYSYKDKEDKGDLIYLGMGIDLENVEFKHFWKIVTNG